jgi:DNA adenine methylase
MNKQSPILKYPGAKWRIVNEIVPLIPRTTGYVEPFCGSAAVFFNLPWIPEYAVLNDAYQHIVRFFQVLRNTELRHALIEAIVYTPWSREEHAAAFNLKSVKDPVEFARRFAVSSWQTLGGDMSNNSGWRRKGLKGMATNSPTYEKWNRLPDTIAAVVHRLKQAEIENRDALEVITYYNDPDVTLYVDPPYLKNVRAGKRRMYAVEMMDEPTHVALADALCAHQGPVGY